MPQGCTVSDMNDSEYYNKEGEDRKRKVIKKRSPIQSKRKARVREKDIVFYDRDAKNCSQLNINLDCSSTDMMKCFNGDGKRVSKWKKNIPTSEDTLKVSNNLSDVWAVLRNINSFQFRPSPPMSEDSIVQFKKKVHTKEKRTNLKDARMIGTCRTQEFAYISSYNVDDKSPLTFSPSSSTDRITVIDNKDKFSRICEKFEKRLLGTHGFLKDTNNTKKRIQNNKTCKIPKSSVKVGNVGSKDNKQLPLKKKKKSNAKSLVVEQSNSISTNINTTNKDTLIGMVKQSNVKSLVVEQSNSISTNINTANKDSLIGTDKKSNAKSLVVEQSNSISTNINTANNDYLIDTDKKSNAKFLVVEQSTGTNISTANKDSQTSTGKKSNAKSLVVEQSNSISTNINTANKDSLNGTDKKSNDKSLVVEQSNSISTNINTANKDSLIGTDKKSNAKSLVVEQSNNISTNINTANKDSLIGMVKKSNAKSLVVEQSNRISTNISTANKDSLIGTDKKSNAKSLVVEQSNSISTNINTANKDSLIGMVKKSNAKSLVVEQSDRISTNISTANKDSLTGTVPLQFNKSFNFEPIEPEKNMYPSKIALDSDDLGSSKTELPNKMNEQVSRNGKSNNIAVLNKEHKSTANINKRLNPQQRKPRLLTTMPSSSLLTKLTQTEIKRKLANMSFPIVVLGKDEVSSSVKVIDYDPPQFNGLDNHIWPFMLEWSAIARKDTKQDKNMQTRICESNLLDSNSESRSRTVNTEEGTFMQDSLKDKKQVNDDSIINKRRPKVTPTVYPEIKDKSLECTKKQKPIVQLKDKMLNFLYKRSSNRENDENDESKPITLDKNFPTAENNNPALTDKHIKKVLSPGKKTRLYKHPWAKAKWASDFIDNVMKKVRRGVYYTQDRKDFCHTYEIDLKKASAEAESPCDFTNFTQTFDKSEGKGVDTGNTPLDKITTLDDFFQIFGCKTTFSKVFDEISEKKILSSVIEMKNWISEINPKQALLVLLLNNKKDTQNLVRFRSIILQGIAVNRITRASELDMEIEVVDRENFNKLPQFEGITYLPESVTNYENLLDELYWIAKTTASDYNKPFDESSERLLKSLLQKRKKLNPSYLRVMARYVGLGLVKTPTECC
ncbi:hypothetical protein PYW07_002804 [Mythimna separata]|uniref:Uncharacterized protein n=1 Tax=Mythimna separata TaxID=271217 RepID=A0AAD8DQ81_MYTSE|nr:hypothetical protein PYW07_002804 [Mythimna separata]